MVYFLLGEGKIADLDEKVDDVVLADLPVLVLLSLLVVVHHPLQHQKEQGESCRDRKPNEGPWSQPKFIKEVQMPGLQIMILLQSRCDLNV